MKPLPSAKTPRRYLFGPFTLETGPRVLIRDGTPLPVPPKAVETLLALIERAGDVVTRDELIERVWPDSFVEPNNLAQHISLVRRVLDDRQAPAAYVETLARRGYRFVAPVLAEDSPAIAPPVAAPAVPAPRAATVPEIRYARSGSVNIAYQTLGEGPIDLVFVMGWVSHLEEFWTEPAFARFLGRLAESSRLILFDKRGTGLSDRVTPLPTLEQRMDDVRAVMQAVGSERAALLGVSEGGPMCSLFAATYPERTHALIMVGSYARRLWAPDYPWGPTADDREAFCAEIEKTWGGPLGIEERAPSRAQDPAFRDWWARYLRHGASPGAAVALTRMNAEVDIRHVLPLVRVPTLVLHRTGDRCLRVEEGRFLASHIPGATFLELPGDDHLPFVGDQDSLLAPIESFLGTLSHDSVEPSMLATVLWIAQRDGDVSGIADRPVADVIDQHRGEMLEHPPDGWLISFDGPARAIRAGRALVSMLSALGVRVSAGLHTGECRRRRGRLTGLAVDVAREVALHAAPGELLLSRTVKDLVAGAGFRFVERGRYPMPEESGEWRLYALDQSARPVPVSA